MQAPYFKADHFRQIATGLIDAAIILLLFWQYSTHLAPRSVYDMPVYPIHPMYLIIAGFILYRFIFLVLLNGTPGMKLLNVILLNGAEEPLSLSEKIMASVCILYRGVEYYKKRQGF